MRVPVMLQIAGWVLLYAGLMVWSPVAACIIVGALWIGCGELMASLNKRRGP